MKRVCLHFMRPRNRSYSRNRGWFTGCNSCRCKWLGIDPDTGRNLKKANR